MQNRALTLIRRSSTGSTSVRSSTSLAFSSPGTIYLRALHSYQPESTINGTERASCLPLQANAIIYVHSIHSSGWADGTLLSGHRGWFPSNYCEPYVLEILQPLTEARCRLEVTVTERACEEYTTAIAAVVACVRELLIGTDCLTRDSPLVRQSEMIKRDRKALLSELSGLVNTTRRESLNLAEVGPDLLHRAGRILIRAGRFVHTTGPISDLYRKEARKVRSVEVTPTPPVSYDFSTPTIAEEDEGCDPACPEADRESVAQFGLNTSALIQLDTTHDALLSDLAAFIGRLHLQSQTQSASHILLATRQCVNAARALLASFEAICAYHPDNTLLVTKDHLYTDITNLVTRAREVVESQRGIISDTRLLITAATGIVRGAGQCTARARYLLETLGDFMLENADAESEYLPRLMARDDTSSSLASLVDHRQSRDVQTQVESLAIPYKKVASLEPRRTEITPVTDDASGRMLETETSTGLPGTEERPPRQENLAPFDEHNLEVTRNSDEQIVGATLDALVACMTPHDKMPDVAFSMAFFLTFRSFATPVELASSLISRFDWTLTCAVADGSWSSTNGKPIRLRIYNVFKNWLECHWRNDEDATSLPLIEMFASNQLLANLPPAGKRLSELVAEWSSSAEGKPDKKTGSLVGRNVTARAARDVRSCSTPVSIISSSQLAKLQYSITETGDLDTPAHARGHVCSIVDFDDVEIARQLTLLESKMFCAINPIELVNQEFSKKLGTSRAVNIKAMSAASTDIAGWVADSILWETEQKRRTAVLKQWIRIGERCAEMNNFNTLMAIMCALNSSTISRLKRTWDGLSRGQKSQLEHLRSITDHQRNYAVYRARIKQAPLPCLPYLGLYRTDLTFVDEGNPSHRPSKISDRSLINFDKHFKTSKIIAELQQFQVSYNYREIPELCAWIISCCLRMRKSSTDLSGNLWRRSLIIEPKLPTAMKREPSYASSNESDSWSTKLSFLPSWATQRE